MEHFYQNIPGWFSYEYIYKDMIEQATDNSLFVEIGSYKGKSAAYMTVEIANSGKDIKFECIDPMELMGDYLLIPQAEKDGYSSDDFHKRLESVKEYYHLNQMTSSKAVELYKDSSIDFIMIDGDHRYQGVKEDVLNFLPKMRPGGLMTGDDAFVPEIIQAVKDAVAEYGQEDLVPEFNGIHFFIKIPE